MSSDLLYECPKRGCSFRASSAHEVRDVHHPRHGVLEVLREGLRELLGRELDVVEVEGQEGEEEDEYSRVF
ncbi:MAG: hypothetical protein MAG715_00850 [Methanonatronarchaeales archaeon]|nr:hypothetical protein [Methanonatronarchaeales archaeon]